MLQPCESKKDDFEQTTHDSQLAAVMRKQIWNCQYEQSVRRLPPLTEDTARVDRMGG
jgi:hypothetical protein